MSIGIFFEATGYALASPNQMRVRTMFAPKVRRLVTETIHSETHGMQFKGGGEGDPA